MKNRTLIIICAVMITALVISAMIASTTAATDVPDGKAGDINMDGDVDNKDVVSLFRFVSGTDVAVDELAADCNGDETVDNKDVVVLFRYVSGMDVELFYGKGGLLLFEENEDGYTVSANPNRKEMLEGKIEIPAKYNKLPVTAIKEGGFEDCVNMTKIKIPSTVVSIGKAAFSGCKSLEPVEIPARVKTIPEECFKKCLAFKDFTVPDYVLTIEKGAFEGCDNIESLTIPFVGKTEDATLYEAVLGYIFGYEKKEIEESVGTVEYDYFVNDKPKSITGMTWQFTNKDVWGKSRYYYNIPETLKTVTITKQTTIPTAAFNGCEKIEYITHTADSEEYFNIGEAAFQDCVSLKFEGDNNNTLKIDKKVRNIGASAYKNCKNIKTLVIPDNVLEIGEAAFYGCDNLESLTVPFVGKTEDATLYEAVLGYIFGYEKNEIEESVGTVEYDYFVNDKPKSNTGMTWQFTNKDVWGKTYFYYYIPETLKTVTITKQISIPIAAFNECTMLKTIYLLDGTNVDAECAFQNCPATIICK